MKNIQVIDGAENCAYDIFACEDAIFAKLFESGTDIQFAEDLSSEKLALLETLWAKPVAKSQANGVHGTLFFNLLNKKKYYPNKSECDLSTSNGRGFVYPP